MFIVLAMRLVADAMLGKLARWLRLAGISVKDAPYNEDERIIAFVKRERATLLTADSALASRARKRKFKVLLVTEGDLVHQLAYVTKKLDLKLNSKPGMLCSVCNHKLGLVSIEKVRDRVPERVAMLHKKFYVCRNCKRVYWEGTHWRAISRTIMGAKRIVKEG
jgi:hypothetical protein